MALAARRMCSSSCRFIFTENGQAFFRAKNAAEGTGLAQTTGLLGIAAQQHENPRDWAFTQNPLPLQQRSRRIGLSLVDPSIECPGRLPQEVRLGRDLVRNPLVQRQAALINPLVR